MKLFSIIKNILKNYYKGKKLSRKTKLLHQKIWRQREPEKDINVPKLNLGEFKNGF